MTSAAHQDSLQVLREYRNLAPWNLRDLAGLVGAILDASAVTPINAAARAQPSQRTVRFYVTRGLVSPPEGRGTAATYSYRHFLQLLWIKLRQMEGGTLAAITKEMQDQTGVELNVDTGHPLVRLGTDEAALAEAVRQAIAKLAPPAPA